MCLLFGDNNFCEILNKTIDNHDIKFIDMIFNEIRQKDFNNIRKSLVDDYKYFSYFLYDYIFCDENLRIKTKKITNEYQKRIIIINKMIKDYYINKNEQRRMEKKCVNILGFDEYTSHYIKSFL